MRVPADLAAALKKSKKAQAGFDALSPSHKREYIEWITEAKTAETRARRLAQAIEWMAEGKSRNWKYEQKGLGRWGLRLAGAWCRVPRAGAIVPS